MLLIFFLLGLIFGSFVNAVVYRLEAVESLWERSHCPKCKKQISWRDNIPLLSFLLLTAKCRECGEKISWQYPVVELVLGILFALVGNYFFLATDVTTWLQTVFLLLIFTILAIIFLYDLKYMEIPMVVLWIGVGIAVAYMLLADWNSFQVTLKVTQLTTYAGVLGAFVAFLFFYLLASVSKETWMGYGDAFIGLLAGLVVGWPLIVPTLMLSFTIGALVSVPLLLLHKKTMQSQVPFAPFLIAATGLAIFLPKIFPALQFFPFYF